MPRLILGRNAASPPLLKSKALQRMLHAAKLSYGFTARLNQLRLIPVDSSRMLYLKLFLMPCTDLGCVNQVYKKDAPTIIVGAFHLPVPAEDCDLDWEVYTPRRYSHHGNQPYLSLRKTATWIGRFIRRADTHTTAIEK